jgi:hypothetical protein
MVQIRLKPDPTYSDMVCLPVLRAARVRRVDRPSARRPALDKLDSMAEALFAAGGQRGRCVRPAGSRLRGRRAAACVTLLLVVTSAVVGCGEADAPGGAATLWVAPADATRLDAEVTFTGTQFVVENRTGGLWRDVDVQVGRDRDAPPYRYRADAILGGRSVTVGALNFERPDGSRLSPFRVQPTRWAVSATLPDGRTGFVEGRFAAASR